MNDNQWHFILVMSTDFLAACQIVLTLDEY